MSEGKTMGLLERGCELLETAYGDRLDGIVIERAVLGLFFSGVKLSTGHGGLCFTPIKEIPEAVCCPSSARAMPSSGKLSGRSAREYLADVRSDNVLKRTLGIATMNALSALYWDERGPVYVDGSKRYVIERETDAFDVFELERGRRTVVVGALVPMLRRLLAGDHDFHVLEMDPRTLKGAELDHYLPADRAADVIPDATQLVITGTTLINGTLDGLLALAPEGARILVTGPTVSMLPDALIDAGITMVGGTLVTDADAALDIISEAGSGYHLFGRSATRFVIRSASSMDAVSNG